MKTFPEYDICEEKDYRAGTDYYYKKAADKYGMFVRFIKFNNIVYSIGSLEQGIVPALQSDRYKEFSFIIDAAIAGLNSLPDGSYIFPQKHKKWILLPISFPERCDIARFDESAINNIPLHCPSNVVVPA